MPAFICAAPSCEDGTCPATEMICHAGQAVIYKDQAKLGVTNTLDISKRDQKKYS